MRLPNGQEITSLREAQAIMTSAFPEFIRMASFDWVVRGWEQFQTTYQQIYQLQSTSDPVHTYYERAGMTTLPAKDEGQPYAAMGIATTPLLTFHLIKRGGIIAITDEMIKFDKAGQINNFATDFGVAAKRTMEAAAWDLLTCPAGASTSVFNQASVYQSASSSTAPWVNQGTLQFTGDNLVQTMILMERQKDAQGNLLGIMPNAIIVPLDARHAVHQLLDSDWVGFTGSTQKDGVSGVPTANPYKGKIAADRVYSSPFFTSSSGTTYTSASFPWALFDLNNAPWKILEVAPLEVLHEDPQAAASVYFERDEIRMRARLWNCPALAQPRAAYYQTFVY